MSQDTLGRAKTSLFVINLRFNSKFNRQELFPTYWGYTYKFLFVCNHQIKHNLHGEGVKIKYFDTIESVHNTWFASVGNW